jgi:hypothetical protein
MQGSAQVYHPGETICIPLYYTASREQVVVSLDVPCAGDEDKWIQTGVAFFLRNWIMALNPPPVHCCKVGLKGLTTSEFWGTVDNKL